MLKVRIAVAAFLLCAAGLAQNPPNNHIPHLTPDQWRQDLHALATGIARLHKNAFHFTSKTKFESAVSDLDKQIPALEPYEIMVGMMRILAMVGDGHTRSDDLFNSFSQFPISLYWFTGELRVILATPKYKQAIGGKVVAIGSTSIAGADQKVRSIIEQHETGGVVETVQRVLLGMPRNSELFRHHQRS